MGGQLDSSDPLVRLQALVELQRLGAEAAPAGPAVLRLLREGASTIVAKQRRSTQGWLRDVARPLLPTLKKSLARERSPWARREMQLALDDIAR